MRGGGETKEKARICVKYKLTLYDCLPAKKKYVTMLSVEVVNSMFSTYQASHKSVVWWNKMIIFAELAKTFSTKWKKVVSTHGADVFVSNKYFTEP